MEIISGRVLIVEDEVNIRAGLRDILTRDNHVVVDVGSGEEALAALASTPYDVAIVDIRMPGMSGVELMHAIYPRWRHLAVIILTGHGDLETAMAAVKAGAHDYLLKPAQPEMIRQTVLEALAKARRRREQALLLEALRTSLSRLDGTTSGGVDAPLPPPETHLMEINGLHIDLRSHEVRHDDTPIHLSPTEFKLLATLAAHEGEVVDYATLAQLSLGYDTELWEAKELLKRHIFAVRQKIEPDPASPCYLLNVRGVGYKLSSPP